MDFSRGFLNKKPDKGKERADSGSETNRTPRGLSTGDKQLAFMGVDPKTFRKEQGQGSTEKGEQTVSGSQFPKKGLDEPSTSAHDSTSPEKDNAKRKEILLAIQARSDSKIRSELNRHKEAMQAIKSELLDMKKNWVESLRPSLLFELGDRLFDDHPEMSNQERMNLFREKKIEIDEQRQIYDNEQAKLNHEKGLEEQKKHNMNIEDIIEMRDLDRKKMRKIEKMESSLVEKEEYIDYTKMAKEAGKTYADFKASLKLASNYFKRKNDKTLTQSISRYGEMVEIYMSGNGAWSIDPDTDLTAEILTDILKNDNLPSTDRKDLTRWIRCAERLKNIKDALENNYSDLERQLDEHNEDIKAFNSSRSYGVPEMDKWRDIFKKAFQENAARLGLDRSELDKLESIKSSERSLKSSGVYKKYRYQSEKIGKYYVIFLNDYRKVRNYSQKKNDTTLTQAISGYGEMVKGHMRGNGIWDAKMHTNLNEALNGRPRNVQDEMGKWISGGKGMKDIKDELENNYSDLERQLDEHNEDIKAFNSSRSYGVPEMDKWKDIFEKAFQEKAANLGIVENLEITG